MCDIYFFVSSFLSLSKLSPLLRYNYWVLLLPLLLSFVVVVAGGVVVLLILTSAHRGDLIS